MSRTRSVNAHDDEHKGAIREEGLNVRDDVVQEGSDGITLPRPLHTTTTLQFARFGGLAVGDTHPRRRILVASDDARLHIASGDHCACHARIGERQRHIIDGELPWPLCAASIRARALADRPPSASVLLPAVCKSSWVLDNTANLNVSARDRRSLPLSLQLLPASCVCRDAGTTQRQHHRPSGSFHSARSPVDLYCAAHDYATVPIAL
ncbi:hypothetical protein SNOG_03722 [Parastagonospora nodorum SN15]|uniref:Uncharacterized protein n=1 Tax=Phaeosphaeria nodorum (strain SN15 / ATCC MYA-4574 / FGSC 10173) TaxID=321614 RepID=Q0UWZ2_PHANO|nr:hypothetical protein SNOG_03722 [Parastagonospora nodorum SN15]EAT88927.1 hypothetical protein SNOG_03722 [Parastagonospora nodorum SN15]